MLHKSKFENYVAYKIHHQQKFMKERIKHISGSKLHPMPKEPSDYN